MSKIEVDTIDTQSSTTLQVGSTNTSLIKIGTSGDTVEYPAGTTFTQSGTQNVTSGGAINVKSGGSIIIESGAAITNNGTATGFSADLTNLNATNLTSGTVPDARFPATLPAANGSALTNLNATNLGSGTVPDARFPATLPAISGANLTNLPGGGAYNLLSTTTISSQVASVSITSNIDSTYRDYMFIFSDIHTSADDRVIQANVYSSNGSPDVGGSSYNCAGVGYRSDNAGLNQASASTDYPQISLWGQGNADAEAGSLILYMFNPSGTTHNKSFMSTSIAQTIDGRTAVGTNGFLYRNGTVAVTGMRFLPSSGYFHSGVIKLYGIS